MIPIKLTKTEIRQCEQAALDAGVTLEIWVHDVLSSAARRHAQAKIEEAARRQAEAERAARASVTVEEDAGVTHDPDVEARIAGYEARQYDRCS